jgi:hypothetical protein
MLATQLISDGRCFISPVNQLGLTGYFFTFSFVGEVGCWAFAAKFCCIPKGIKWFNWTWKKTIVCSTDIFFPLWKVVMFVTWVLICSTLSISGEAGVPFFHASGSEFDEMFVGLGAKRIRQLFSE